ncbi:MAG: S1C family serine protease [Clostridia bacterium]|nr:S1C family serine protease [Clostridia bacterium]
MKKTTFFISVLLALCALFAFVGCGEISSGGENLDAGEQTQYAPQDTEQYISHEWQLYEEAKEIDGYTGTFMDFLKDIGFTATDDTAAIHYALTSAVCVESTFGTGTGSPGSRGAGVIYSLDTTQGDAYIITNYHVIYGKNQLGQYGVASKINVYLYGGYVSSRAISATFYGGEMDRDIAVLAVKNAEVFRETENNPVYARAAKIGTSGVVAAGDKIYAIGNPNGDGLSVTAGVVSVPYQGITVLRADDAKNIVLPAIKINAAVNHGNSGGGLFNADGKLIGIVNARSENEASVGFAIPSVAFMKVIRGLGL